MKIKMRRGPLTFALIALGFCGLIVALMNRFLPENVAGSNEPLASFDCQNWQPQSKIGSLENHPHVFYKDGPRLTYMSPGPQVTISLVLESQASMIAKDYSFAKLESDYLIVLTKHSFGLLDLQSDATPRLGMEGLNRSLLTYGQLVEQGEWILTYEQNDKPLLTAKIKDLGILTCKSDGCFFAQKDNIQSLPLEQQPEVASELKKREYFGKKLQPLKDACTNLHEAQLRSSFGRFTADVTTACMIDSTSVVPNISDPTTTCEVLNRDVLPLVEKLN